jgi:hypothetical protein
LTETACSLKLDEANYLYAQTGKGIIIQFLMNINTSQYSMFASANGSLHQIRDILTPDAPVIKPINLTTLYQQFTKQNIITVQSS